MAPGGGKALIIPGGNLSRPRLEYHPMPVAPKGANGRVSTLNPNSNAAKLEATIAALDAAKIKGPAVTLQGNSPLSVHATPSDAPTSVMEAGLRLLMQMKADGDVKGSTRLVSRDELAPYIQSCLPDEFEDPTHLMDPETINQVWKDILTDPDIVLNKAGAIAFAGAVGNDDPTVTGQIPAEAAKLSALKLVDIDLPALTSPGPGNVEKSVIKSWEMLRSYRDRPAWAVTLKSLRAMVTTNGDAYPASFRMMVRRAFAAVEGTLPGLQREVMLLDNQLRDPALESGEREKLNSELWQKLVLLDDQIGALQKWTNYFEERQQAMRTTAAFATPFGTDITRNNVVQRILEEAKNNGGTFEEAAHRLGLEPPPASVFSSPILSADFVEPVIGTDLSGSAASGEFGIAMKVQGDPVKFAGDLQNIIKTRGSQVFVTGLGDKLQNDTSLKIWEGIKSVEIDSANPTRLILTKDIEFRTPDGQTHQREMKFFVDVKGN